MLLFPPEGNHKQNWQSGAGSHHFSLYLVRILFITELLIYQQPV